MILAIGAGAAVRADREISFARVARLEQTPGLALMLALVIGMVAANIEALAPWYGLVHHLPVHFGVGPFQFREPLIGFVNDGLLVFFFLLVALELKRELLEGHLAGRGAAVVPAVAAIGGMAAPAVVYVLASRSDAVALRGWAIPTATDIVLALGVMSLLGRRVPPALKILLTSVAIFDDIGAVLVIALFYGEGLSVGMVLIVALEFTALALVGHRRVRRPLPYALLGAALWITMLAARLEPALAGVLIGATIPMRAASGADSSPLVRLEHLLHGWVVWGVVPLFVFLNGGLAIDAGALRTLLAPASAGVVLGLILGKPVGITAGLWLALRLRPGGLPSGVSWAHLWGAAMLGGVGFTMSLFTATLAFPDPQAASAVKLAVLLGSTVAATAGLIVLAHASRAPG